VPRSESSLSVCLDYLRFIKKHDLHKRFKAVAEANQGVIDDSLLAAWTESKRNKMTPRRFIETYHNIVDLISSLTDLEAVLSEGESWGKVATELHRLCAHKCGRAMFSTGLQGLLVSEVEAAMGSCMKELEGKVLNEGVVEGVQRAILQAVDKIPGAGGLAGRRTVAMQYRSVLIEVPVASVTEESWLRIAAVIKEYAVKDNILTRWWCEDDVCGAPTQGMPKIAGVSESLLRSMDACRVAANSL
jgi:hypothetical protein